MAHAIVVAKAAHQAIFKTSPRPLGASHVPPGSIKGRAHRLDAAAAPWVRMLPPKLRGVCGLYCPFARPMPLDFIAPLSCPNHVDQWSDSFFTPFPFFQDNTHQVVLARPAPTVPQGSIKIRLASQVVKRALRVSAYATTFCNAYSPNVAICAPRQIFFCRPIWLCDLCLWLLQ